MKKRESKKRAIKTKHIALIIVCAILIGAGAALSIISMSGSPDIKTFDMQLKVGSYLGFNVNNSALFFGTIPPGGTGSREIVLTNTDGSARVVKLRAMGELENWTSVSKNNIHLGSGENTTITVYVAVPADANFGDYTGKLEIYFQKPVLFGLFLR